MYLLEAILIVAGLDLLVLLTFYFIGMWVHKKFNYSISAYLIAIGFSLTVFSLLGLINVMLMNIFSPLKGQNAVNFFAWPINLILTIRKLFIG